MKDPRQVLPLVPLGIGVRAQAEVFQHGHVLNDAPPLHHLKNARAHDGVRGHSAQGAPVVDDVAAGDRAVLAFQQAGYRL